MSIKEKKLGGRPKLASYQKRTKCFRVMFTENDYIYIQSKAEQAGLSVNEFCHQAAMDCQVCQRILTIFMYFTSFYTKNKITTLHLTNITTKQYL